MKRMKLSTKLIFGFSCLAVMLIVGGAIGSYGIHQTEKALKDANKVRLPGIEALGAMKEAQTFARVPERSLLVPEFAGSEDLKNRQIANLDAVWQKIDQAAKTFEDLPKSEAQSALWGKVKASLAAWKKDYGLFTDLIRTGKRDEALVLSNGRLRDSYYGATKDLDDLLALNMRETQEHGGKVEKAAAAIKILALGGTFIGVVLAVVFGIVFSLMITRPIIRVIEGITEGANQVASASSQVAAASLSLADSASQQAASLQETSASVEELSSMTKQNADNAQLAKGMVTEAGKIVENVNRHMGNMTGAITEAMKSSEETSKIVKTIDEIAFQTNLLALNAAVEAARAGEAGAGFAVVADEVRNLAMRSAEAARNTSELIENTINSVKAGHEATQITQEAFRGNVEISNKIAGLIDEIAAASSEQAQGIGQINTAVNEMDKVTQSQASSADDSASAAEELNGQAMEMKRFVADLDTIITGGGGEGRPSPAAPFRRNAAAKADVSPSRQAAGKAVPQPAAGNSAKMKPAELIPLDDDFKNF